MKIATLCRKDGKVILETDNDAIAQVATDTPQDVVVMAAHYFTGERQVGRPAALAAPYGQNVPPHGMVAGRIDAAILGRAMVKHQLWEKGDAGLPTVLTDRNGDVVLGMCRVCGQAEAELEDACPGYKWPEGAVALVWSAVGLGKWVTADSSTGTWGVDLADVPMPAGWDWRVPVMRQQPTRAIDLARVRASVQSLLNWIDDWAETPGESGIEAIAEEAEAVLALIDGQKEAPRGPDQLDLCDLCRVREEVRTDADGIPFCQECWDGWQASEQTSKGEGE